jgi:hypothetical protein
VRERETCVKKVKGGLLRKNNGRKGCSTELNVTVEDISFFWGHESRRINESGWEKKQQSQ